MGANLQQQNQQFNGQGQNWKEPKLVAKSDKLARPALSNVQANEYLDDNETLNQKIQLLADAIKSSENFCVYTGAGISTSSGINDYASKAKNTITKTEKVSNYLQASPTESHYILAALERKGYLKHWIQQNHDGLAQKAGYPDCLEKINEIHGSWWDMGNPVVMMDQSLPKKNFKKLNEWTKKADLVLALGTSLSGMNADMVAAETSIRAQEGVGFGLCIINLQKTNYDGMSQLRIFGDLDKTLKILAKKLNLNVVRKEVSIRKTVGQKDTFEQ